MENTERVYKERDLVNGTSVITTALIIINAMRAGLIQFEVSCCFISLRSKSLNSKTKDMTKNKHRKKTAQQGEVHTGT